MAQSLFNLVLEPAISVKPFYLIPFFVYNSIFLLKCTMEVNSAGIPVFNPFKNRNDYSNFADIVKN